MRAPIRLCSCSSSDSHRLDFSAVWQNFGRIRRHGEGTTTQLYCCLLTSPKKRPKSSLVRRLKRKSSVVSVAYSRHSSPYKRRFEVEVAQIELTTYCTVVRCDPSCPPISSNDRLLSEPCELGVVSSRIFTGMRSRSRPAIGLRSPFDS